MSSGDLTIASATIDRIVHHADVISLKGNGYRLKRHQPTPVPHNRTTTPWPRFQLALMALFSVGVNISREILRNDGVS